MADEMRINPIRPNRIEVDPRQMTPAKTKSTEGASFKDILAESIGEVERLQDEADITIKKLVSGEIKDVTDAMIAIEKADVSFQTMMAVRNRIIAAYEEIMRMQA